MRINKPSSVAMGIFLLIVSLVILCTFIWTWRNDTPEAVGELTPVLLLLGIPSFFFGLNFIFGDDEF